MTQQTSITRYMVRHAYLTRAILVGIVTFLLVLLGLIPLINRIRELSANIGIKRKEAVELSDKVTILAGIDQAVLDERVKVLDKALPPRKDVIVYLTAVDGLSRELNLNFGGIALSPGEVTEGKETSPGLHTLDTDIKIAGTQENIYSFLRLIEQSAPLMQIKDVKVVQSATNDSFTLSLKLGMLWAASDPKSVKGQIALFDEKEEKYFQDLSQFRQFTPITDGIAVDVGLGKTDLFEQQIAN